MRTSALWRKRWWPTALIGLCWAAAGQAQPQPQADLLDLSLEDLLAVKVSSVSLGQQDGASAAALVDVLTAERLKAQGVRNLSEALSLLPAIRILQRQTFTNAYAAVYGNAVNDNDNHLLILMNGVPWRASTVGGSNRLLYDSFPLALVDRIEFVRGQAGTLHGSNAVSGVVNIVTKAPQAAGAQLEAEVGAGPTTGAAQWHIGDGDRGATLFAGRQSAWGDWPLEQVAIALRNGSFARVNGTMEQTGDAWGVMAHWGETRLQWMGLRSNSTNASSAQFGSSYVPPVRDNSVAARLTHVAHWGEWNLHAALAADRSRIAFDVTEGYSRRESLRLALESPQEATWRGFVGVQGAKARGSVQGLFPEWRSREWSVFAQTYVDVMPGLELGLGATSQRVKDGGSGTTPQASLVWAPEGPWRAKLLSGRSFRNADARERFSNAAFQRGDPTLKPERGRIDALELGWADAGFDASARLFRQNLSDLIVLVPAADRRLTFTNRERARFSGMEWQARWAPSSQWRLDSSWVRLFGLDDTQQPKDLLRMQAAFVAEAGWQLGAAIEAAGASPRSSRVQAVRPVLNPPAAGYVRANVHLRLPLGQWWSALPESFESTLHVSNLGDTDTWQATSVNPLNTLPYAPPREVRLGFSTQF